MYSDYSSHMTGELERIPDSVIVHLSKTKPTIGKTKLCTHISLNARF